MHIKQSRFYWKVTPFYPNCVFFILVLEGGLYNINFKLPSLLSKIIVKAIIYKYSNNNLTDNLFIASKLK